MEAMARASALTTATTLTHALEAAVAMALAGRSLTARQLRWLAQVVGTSAHYGEFTHLGAPSMALYESAARRCEDDPYTGGDFGAWLFYDDGEDW